MDTSVIRRLTVVGTTQGLTQVAGELNQVAAAQEHVATASTATATVTDNTARRALSAAAAYERVRQQLDQTARMQAQFERSARTIDAALQQGIIAAGEHAQSMAALESRYGATAQAAERTAVAMRNQARAAGEATAANRNLVAGMGDAGRVANDNFMANERLKTGMGGTTGAMGAAAGAAKLTAFETQNIGFQLTDLGVQLASGSSPFMAIVQQGGQVSGILGQRGIGGALSAIGTGLVGLVNPVNLFIAGLAAAAAAIPLLWRAWKDDAPDVEESMERHADLIKRMGDAYGAAAVEARRLREESRGVLEFNRQQAAEDVRRATEIGEQVAREFEDIQIETQRSGRFGALFSGLAGPADVLQEVVDKFKAGQIGVLAFREEIERLQSLDDLNEGLEDAVKRLMRITEEASRAALALGGEGLGAAISTLMDRLQGFFGLIDAGALGALGDWLWGGVERRREVQGAGAGGFSHSVLDAPAQYQAAFVGAGQMYGIDPNLLASIAHRESRFNPNARGEAGELGIMQFMPGTAADYGLTNRADPAASITAAAHLMRDLLDKFGGNVQHALMGYNWGQGRVESWIARGSDPSKIPPGVRDYVSAIMRPGAAGAPGGAGADPLAAATEYAETQKDLVAREAEILGGYQRETQALAELNTMYGQSEAAISLHNEAQRLHNQLVEAGIAVTPELTEQINAQAAARVKAAQTAEETAERTKNALQAQNLVGTGIINMLMSVQRGWEGVRQAALGFLNTLIQVMLQAMLLGQGPLAGLFGVAGKGLLTPVFSGLAGGGFGGGGAGVAGAATASAGAMRAMSGGGGALNINVNPVDRVGVSMQTRARRRSDGGLDLDLIVDQMKEDMEDEYGVSKRRVRR